MARTEIEPPLICLMGASLDSGNRGVAALSASLIGLVRHSVPGARPCLVVGNRSNAPYKLNLGDEAIEIPVLNYRKSPRAPLQRQLWWIFFLAVIYRCCPFVRNGIRRLNPWIRTVAQARCVGDIRGGDSFSDIYGLRNFVMGSIPVISALLVNRNFVLLPQTYGPFKSRAAHLIAAFIVRRARHVVSRDQDSIPLAASMTSEPIRFSPDVAFTLKPIAPKTDGIEPPLDLPAGVEVVGINVNGLMLNGGYTRQNMFGLKLDYRQFLVSLIDRILRESNAHLLFVPHTFAPPESVESDPAACEQLIGQIDARFKDRIHMVRVQHDQSQIKWVIGRCQFFVGSRMHACIAALSQGVPALGVAYSKKFKGVFDSVGVADWVLDGRGLEAEEAVSRAMEFFAKRDKMREKLVHSVPPAQQQVYDLFQEMFGERDRLESKRSPELVIPSHSPVA